MQSDDSIFIEYFTGVAGPCHKPPTKVPIHATLRSLEDMFSLRSSLASFGHLPSIFGTFSTFFSVSGIFSLFLPLDSSLSS